MEKIEKQNIQEKTEEINYDDLIELYYFEALRHKRPVVERKFEEITQKVAEKLLNILETHAYVMEDRYSDKELAMGNKDAALVGYFKTFHHDLRTRLDDKNFDANSMVMLINGFIMYVHERIRRNLGEDLLGLSEKELHALNFIDIDKPLDQQERIIFKKLEELK